MLDLRETVADRNKKYIDMIEGGRFRFNDKNTELNTLKTLKDQIAEIENLDSDLRVIVNDIITIINSRDSFMQHLLTRPKSRADLISSFTSNSYASRSHDNLLLQTSCTEYCDGILKRGTTYSGVMVNESILSFYINRSLSDSVISIIRKHINPIKTKVSFEMNPVLKKNIRIETIFD